MGKGTAFPGSPRSALTFSSAYIFQSSHRRGQKALCLGTGCLGYGHSKETASLPFSRGPRGATPGLATFLLRSRATHGCGGSSHGSRENGQAAAGVPQKQPPKSRLAPGVPGITASQAEHAATGGLAGTKSSLSRPCRGNRAPASQPWGHVLHRLTHTTNKFSSICTKHAAAAAPLRPRCWKHVRPSRRKPSEGGHRGLKNSSFCFSFFFFLNGLRRNTKNYFSIAPENAHGLTETIKGRAVAHAWTRTVTEGD